MIVNSHQLGPKKTPRIIKFFISLTAILSILVAVIPHKYIYYFFGLSLLGLKNWFLWQPLTALFLIPIHNISFNFVFKLAFNLYFFWIFSCSIIELKSKKSFIYLICICSLATLFFTILLMKFMPSNFIFSGGNILIYVTAIAWLMLHNNTKFFLFSLPIKAKWLILGIITLNLLSLLSESQFIYFFVYFFCMILTYIFCLIRWHIHSPLNFLNNLEKNIIYFFTRKKNRAKSENNSSSKIYGFKTKAPLDEDEIFMDKMLHKISAKGEGSLTKKEKERLKKISKTKKKQT